MVKEATDSQDCSGQNKCVYLAEGPEGLANSCDILLILDDGTQLPAHSQVLARYSKVFSDMLGGGPLFSASPSSKIDLPLSGCSGNVVIKFLSAIYSARPYKHINEEVALPVAELAHKYGMKVR